MGVLKKKTAFICLLIIITMAVPVLFGFVARASEKGRDPVSLSDFDGKSFGTIFGTVSDETIEEAGINGYHLVRFNSYADLYTALGNGKVDAAVLDLPIACYAANRYETFRVFPEQLNKTFDQYAFGFEKGSELPAKFDTVIERCYIDGTMDRLEEVWLGTDESRKVLPNQDWPGTNGTLTCWISPDKEPMTYIGKDGRPAGYEVALLYIIAKELDYRLVFENSEFATLVPGLMGGRCDIAASCLSITDERKEIIDFSAPIFDGGSSILYYSVEAEAEARNRSPGLVEGIAEGFRKALVEEGRWQVIAGGLFTTVLISISSLLLGLALGLAVSILMGSGRKGVALAIGACLRFVQGIPVVVILMILYYAVFGRVDIPGVVVAIIGFSIKFAANAAGVFRVGIDSVDRGQADAAAALGYTEAQAFWKVVFPQAAGCFMPPLREEFVLMVKMTSVVGYIAVEDLARASDLVRSQSLEAFIPLFLTAVVYFVIVNAFGYVLTIMERGFLSHGRA